MSVAMEYSSIEDEAVSPSEAGAQPLARRARPASGA